MRFVDRKREYERLQKALNRDGRQFIVVYGRRRIGKSTLIKKVLRLSPAEDIYFQADETNTANQLYLLSKAIATVFPSFDTATYPDWRSLLEALDRKHLLLGECKWTEADYAERLFNELNEKAALFPVPKSVRHIHTKLFLKEQPLDDINENIFLPEDVIDMCNPEK